MFQKQNNLKLRRLQGAGASGDYKIGCSIGRVFQVWFVKFKGGSPGA